jgi:hypothetical protein
MAEKRQLPIKTYRGNCHCGAFIFELDSPEITQAVSCNCSICHKKGTLWILPENPGNFRIIKGHEDELSKYQASSVTAIHMV